MQYQNLYSSRHYHHNTSYSSAKHFVAVATPVPPSTVFLPPMHCGPSPNNLLTTVVVLNVQPLQSINSVCVLAGTVMVQPKGAVEVMTLVQVGEAEQAVMVVVVFGRGLGRAQRTFGFCVSSGTELAEKMQAKGDGLRTMSQFGPVVLVARAQPAQSV